MARKTPANKPTTNGSKKTVKKSKRTRRIKPSSTMEAYRRLLLDPCHADFAPPPGLGPGSGLFVRLRKNIVMPAGVGTTSSCALVLNPATGKYTIKAADSASTSVTWPAASDLLSGTLIGSSTVQSYRAVAGCAKWISTGPIGERKGSIHYGYVLDQVAVSGETFTINNLRELLPASIGNSGASKIPEVKWFPSDPADLEFRSKSVTYNADTSSLVYALADLDSVSGICNGYFEVTIVYEWIPDYGSGIASAIVAPPSYSIGQVLSTIGNIGMAAVSSEAGSAAIRYLSGVAYDNVRHSRQIASYEF